MRIGVLGTGSVGRALGGKLTQLGHEVMLGTRDVETLMARPRGEGEAESFAAWLEGRSGISVGSFAEAAAHGELLFNCTSGGGSLQALASADDRELGGKVLVDVANPLAFDEGGMSLFVPSTDSLAEQIQRQHPRARVVKALNTVNYRVMVDPASVAGGDHTVFVCGDDEEAKATVSEILRSFGWRHVLDLGDLSAARGVEAYLLLWIRMMQATGSPTVTVKVVT